MASDMVGNLIRPGDLIVSAATQGQSGTLRMAVVESVMGSNTVRVNRVTRSYRGKMNTRRFTESSCDHRVIVVRWDSIKKDSEYHDILQRLKQFQMQQVLP